MYTCVYVCVKSWNLSFLVKEKWPKNDINVSKTHQDGHPAKELAESTKSIHQLEGAVTCAAAAACVFWESTWATQYLAKIIYGLQNFNVHAHT